jgi:hypothetical protein
MMNSGLTARLPPDFVRTIDSPKAEKGTSRQYAIRRLRKDRPDLHQQVIEKKKSSHAAMKEAGFVKTLTPLDMLKLAWGKASEEERSAFLAFIRDERKKAA